MDKVWQVGILIFNEAEVLDIAGPFEVFSIATNETGTKAFNVKTVAETKKIMHARNGLKIEPDYSFDDAPNFDILIVPGGYGAEEIEIHNNKLLNWIKERANSVEILASVCTGAFLLAKAGLLDGKNATTHWIDIDRFDKDFSNVCVQRDVKFIDEGSIITSAGISAGINMSFHIIQRLLGVEIARKTAKRMEYDIELR